MPPFFCAFGHRVQRQRGLARGFRPVDFDHPAPRQAADAERDVEPERARGNRLDVHRAVVLAQLHHRALAELALDLGERGGQGLGLIHGGSFDDTQGSGGHRYVLLMAGIRERDKRAEARSGSAARRNLVPPLFYVRNMFFSRKWRFSQAGARERIPRRWNWLIVLSPQRGQLAAPAFLRLTGAAKLPAEAWGRYSGSDG